MIIIININPLNINQISLMNCCKKIKNKFAYIIMPSIVGIATSGLLFQYYHFIPAIETQSTRILLQTLSVTLYLMCFISYFYAIKITNKLPLTLILPRLKSQLKNNHPLYTQKKQCQKENQKYKPPRTSHCHACKCVARMDHHCPYTDNCVGARNLKAFILFCLYGGIFALQFLVLSVVFYFKLSSGAIGTVSELIITIWMVLSFFAFFLTFSMNSLAFGNLFFATKNITQLQMLKGIFLFKDKHGTHPNPYDLGFFTNLNTIFGGDYWLFWWPGQIKSTNDFTQFPMRPPITAAQIKQLPESVQNQLVDPFVRSIPKTMQQLRKQQQSKYEGVVFFYLGKPYRLDHEEIKSNLAQINNIKIEQTQNQKIDIEKQPDAQQNEEDKQILADIYND